MANPFSNTVSSGLFGATQTPSVFGQATQQQTGSPFGQSLPQTGSFGHTSPNSGLQTGQAQPGSVFGQTGSSSGFGTSQAFSSSTARSGVSQTPSFGIPGSTNVFGQAQSTVFGQTSTATGPGLFGQASSVASPGLFGQSTGAGFGQPAAVSGSSSGNLGQNQGGVSTFGQPTSVTSATSMYGSAPATTNTFGGTPGFGQPATSVFGSPVFGQTSGSSSGPFGQTAVQTAPFGHQATFGQPTTSGTSSSTGLFGQSSSGTLALGQPASGTGSSTGLFGQAASGTSAFGQPPVSSTSSSTGLFGQSTSGTSAFGQPPASSTSSSTGLFGQSASGMSAFGQPTSSSSGSSTGLFGQSASGTSAFSQPTASNSGSSTGLFGQPASGTSGLGQPTSSSSTSSSFGQSLVGSSVFQSQAASTSSNVFGGSAFSQQTGSSAFRQPSVQHHVATTNLFGQPSSTSGSATASTTVSTSAMAVFGGNAFGATIDAKSKAKVGLFGKETAATTQTGTSYLGSLLSKETGAASGHIGGAGLFGKKEKLDQPGQQFQQRGIFGKRPLESQSIMTSSVQVKQEPPEGRSSLFGKHVKTQVSGHDSSTVQVKQEPSDGHSSLFGKPIKTEVSDHDAVKKGLFGKVDTVGQQTSTEGPEQKASSFMYQRSLAEGQVKQEKRETKQATSRSSGLFGRIGARQPQPAQGLFGKPPAKDEKDREDYDERGFRPRLPRVQENTDQLASEKPADLDLQCFQKRMSESRSLFGKPVAQTARQTRGSDEAVRGRRTSFSRQVSSDVSKVAIICKNVPTKFNNHTVLRRHFERFGRVTKVFPNAARMQATVHFETHDAAFEAKRRGRVLARGYPPMSIFWSTYSAPHTTSPRHSDEDMRRGREPDTRSRDEVPSTSRAHAYRQQAGDLDSELESMSGTSDTSYGRKRSPSPRPGETMSRSPEKRIRSSSPGPSTSADTKPKALQLGSFQGSVARTTTDHVQLLDQRDKFIRLNKKKQRDISKAGAFVGTCPDMCPEKERYDREDKRRLSYYEMVPGTENIPGRNPAVDHRRAVKEYIRSSPGEDEPLAHELRPLATLEMTMTYLLCEVADQGQEGYWGDWFDFLWNRMRGIRKDITQQQLCDRGTVGLIEKCARFHIFCSERLCEEDMHSFDAKINDENLTKCLQTLREFYHDLEMKQGVFCENEAEFRAYTVLMNLNEGDILREVQKLRPLVRNTPEIKFVLQVYSALNTNNYVRFFRLVKRSSFSNACIMHRYFTQVRNRALTSMMRTYGIGNKPAQIPLSELVRLLGFENEQEASDFCQHYGFTVVDGDVILDRSEYLEPDAAWLPQRSVHLIESKRMISVGEMINGRPLPNFEIHTPSSSFDAQGGFNSAIDLPGAHSVPLETIAAGPTAIEVKGQEEIKQEPVEIKQEPSVPEVAPKITVSNEYVKNLAKMLFWEVIEEKSKEISIEMVDEVQELLDIGNTVLDNTIYSTVKDLSQTVSREVIDDAQAEHEKELKKEREQRHERVVAELTEEFIHEVVEQQSLNLATIKIREVKAQLKQECIARVTKEIHLEMVEEIAMEMVQDCAEDVFETDVTQRLKQLQEFEDIIKLSRAGKFLKRWKKEYKAVTKLKRAMLAFPSSAAMDSKPEQVNRLIKNPRDEKVTDSRFYVNKRARLTVETPLEVNQRQRDIDTQITVQTLYRRLLFERAWQPLDVSRLISQKLLEKLKTDKKGKTRNSLNWKLVVYLPDADAHGDSASKKNIATKELCDWLKAKLSKGKRPPPEKIKKTEVLSLYKSTVSRPGSKFHSPPLSLGICVRSVTGLPSDDELIMMDEERCMLGTDGIIFVLPADPPLKDSTSKYWDSNLHRLQDLLEVKPTFQAFPLVILVPVPANQIVTYDCLSECLNLDQFIDQGLICDVNIVTLNFDEKLSKGIDVVVPEVSEKLCEGIQWLADLSRLPPDISVSYLKDCLENFLMEEYYTPVLQNLRKRKMLDRFHPAPDLVLELYNAVIQHLTDTLSYEFLTSVSWPVAEFIKKDDIDSPAPYWNTDDQFEYLNQLLQSLKLPQFVSFFSQPDNWPLARQNVSNFVYSVIDKEYGPARVQLTSRLKKLLHQVEVDFEETCYLTEGVDQCQPTYSNIPWTDVISICIDYKLATLDVMDPNINTQDGSGGELKVAFFQSELQNFVPPQAWRHIESDKSILDTPSVEDTIHTAAEKVREKLADATIAPKPVIVVEQENLPPELKETSTSSQKLIKSLQAERRRSDHFQKYLENAMKDDQAERATMSEFFEELPSDIDFQDKFINDTSVFEKTDGAAKLKTNDFTLRDNEADVSMGTRLFGNQTIQFNERSCFGSPDLSNKNVGKTATLKRKSLDDVSKSSKRLSLDLPRVSGNEIQLSDSFLNQTDSSQLDTRESRLGLDYTALPARSRRQRLSEVYGDDKVMLTLCEPTFSDELKSLKEQLKANRRESDLFEKKLLSVLSNDSLANESF